VLIPLLRMGQEECQAFSPCRIGHHWRAFVRDRPECLDFRILPATPDPMSLAASAENHNSPFAGSAAGFIHPIMQSHFWFPNLYLQNDVRPVVCTSPYTAMDTGHTKSAVIGENRILAPSINKALWCQSMAYGL
jgi:hypothetical protein